MKKTEGRKSRETVPLSPFWYTFALAVTVGKKNSKKQHIIVATLHHNKILGARGERYLQYVKSLFCIFVKALICNLPRSVKFCVKMTVYPLLQKSLYNECLTENFRIFAKMFVFSRNFLRKFSLFLYIFVRLFSQKKENRFL
jgi:hypothetical protein